MVLATLLLICSIPQMDDTAKVVNDLPAVSSDSANKRFDIGGCGACLPRRRRK